MPGDEGKRLRQRERNRKRRGTAPGSPQVGGRKPGTVGMRHKVMAKIAEHALMSGIKPIEVMLHNMRFYHGRAESLLMRVVERLEETTLTGDDLKEVVTNLKDMNDYRERATSNARDVAPYLHPRLSAIAVNLTNEARAPLPEGLTLDQALAKYEDNLRRFPKQIENTPSVSLATKERA